MLAIAQKPSNHITFDYSDTKIKLHNLKQRADLRKKIFGNVAPSDESVKIVNDNFDDLETEVYKIIK